MDNLDITDEILYKSCKKLEQNLLDSLPNESDIEYEFSNKFKCKMNKLIKYEKRHTMIKSIYSYSKKVAVTFLIITMGLFTVSMSVDAVRLKVINVITEIYEEFTSIIFSKEDNSVSVDSKFKPALPNYIPKGFKVGTSSLNKTIEGGLVIEDEDGNQFIWVPVKHAIYDSEDGTIPNNATNAAKNSSSYKPMAKYQKGYSKTSEKQYFEGIMYTQWGPSLLYKSYAMKAADDYAVGARTYREPSLITGSSLNYSWLYKSGTDYDGSSTYYKDELGFNSANEFGEYLNNEYTNMVLSVKEHGGFYIGRYETSLENNKAISKINKNPKAGITWYKFMYNQDSNINNDNQYYKSESVTSSMIWNSQWDAALNWILEGKYSDKVYTVTGNHVGSIRKTGQTGSDFMNNILDLSSNSLEWTLGAHVENARLYRGGAYFSGSPAYTYTSFRPLHISNGLGSRLVIYIK